MKESKWSAEELSADEWAFFIAQGLETELNDPREDIYTLADGKPVDEAAEAPWDGPDRESRGKELT